MPKVHVARSITIDKSPKDVFAAVSNFETWPVWSPWLLMEPESKFTLADDKQSYHWEGNRVGEGEMAIRTSSPNKKIEFDLNFIKPWKSTADTRMELEDQDGSTRLTWYMDSKLPFFMFFFKRSMEAFIGMDYERGLRMLKEYIEDGRVKAGLEFNGQSEYPGGPFVGIRNTITFENVEAEMGADFERLLAWAGPQSDNVERLICIYHDFNLVKGVCDYTVAAVVESSPESIPDGFVRGEQKPTKVESVTHIGPYHHLGNAWSTMQAMMRNKEFKPVKGYHPFELYENSPHDTPEEALRTRVNFAVQ